MRYNEEMRTDVTEQGVVIPKYLLKGAKEVEIRSENSMILVIPIGNEDPIWSLADNPVSDDGVTDASVNHDKYIYGK